VFIRKTVPEQDEEKQLQRLKHLARGTPDLGAIGLELDNPSLRIRTEAARLLGQVGDASSLTPLKEALLKNYAGRSPRWHRFVGIMATTGLFALVVALLLLLCVAVVWAFSCFALAFGFGGSPNPFGLWDSLSEHRRKNDPFVRAVLNSIEQLVDKHSAIELRPLVPALRNIAADSHHHRGDTRTAALNAISSIEAVAYEVGDLPISSRAQPAGAHDLPVVEGN
jgi:HEAT repeat protein